MRIHENIRRTLFLALGALGGLAFANEAHANQYGELHIKSNTTLTDDRYGDIVFDASNVTLDCANHMVHISSFTKPIEGQKVAIFADTKSRITIRNCRVVGGFDHSIYIRHSSDVSVTQFTASTIALFDTNTSTAAVGLTLGGSIGLFIEHETASVFSVNIPNCVMDGIHVDSSFNTTIFDTTISGCDSDAIIGQDDSGLIIETVDIENNSAGLILSADSNASIRQSVFSNNAFDGIHHQGTNTFFSNNTALGNGGCDAFDDPTSSGDAWQGNDFRKICGSVPAAH